MTDQDGFLTDEQRSKLPAWAIEGDYEKAIHRDTNGPAIIQRGWWADDYQFAYRCPKAVDGRLAVEEYISETDWNGRAMPPQVRVWRRMAVWQPTLKSWKEISHLQEFHYLEDLSDQPPVVEPGKVDNVELTDQQKAALPDWPSYELTTWNAVHKWSFSHGRIGLPVIIHPSWGATAGSYSLHLQDCPDSESAVKALVAKGYWKSQDGPLFVEAWRLGAFWSVKRSWWIAFFPMCEMYEVHLPDGVIVPPVKIPLKNADK